MSHDKKLYFVLNYVILKVQKHLQNYVSKDLYIYCILYKDTVWCVTPCTWHIGLADMTLLQEVSISTATVVCARTIFTQLVTDAPDLTVIIVWQIKQAAIFQVLGNRMRIYTSNVQLEYHDIKPLLLNFQSWFIFIFKTKRRRPLDQMLWALFIKTSLRLTLKVFCKLKYKHHYRIWYPAMYLSHLSIHHDNVRTSVALLNSSTHSLMLKEASQNLSLL